MNCHQFSNDYELCVRLPRRAEVSIKDFTISLVPDSSSWNVSFETLTGEEISWFSSAGVKGY